MTCNRKNPAFTLLESLITVFLVMLLFGLVADLLIGAFRVARFQRQKVAAAEAGQLALNRILCELREACKIDSISAGDPEVVFYKFDATRTLDARSEGNRYQYVIKVRYYRDAAGTLLRDVHSPPSGASQTHVVADGIQGMSFEQDSTTRNVIVSLSVDIKGELRTISSEVAPMAANP